MSIAAGTVAHLVGQLLLASENLTQEGELVFPPKNNRYREGRLQQLAVLAWDIAEAVEAEHTKRERERSESSAVEAPKSVMPLIRNPIQASSDGKERTQRAQAQG